MSGLALVLLALGAVALLAATEAAIVAAGGLRLRHWARETVRMGGWMPPDAIDRPARLLAPVRAARTLAIVAAGALGARALAATRPDAGEAALLAALALAPVLLVAGDALPRAIVQARAGQLFPALGVLVRAGGRAIRPFVRARTRLLPAGRRDPEARRGLEALLVEGEKAGVVEPSEREIIAGVFDFGRTPVREVMTPAERIASAPVDARAEAVARVIRETGYSRIPIWRISPDRVIGFVHVFDLFKLPPDARPRPRRIVRTKGDASCADLLVVMKRRRCHLAVVVEEGRAIGMVTLEDLVEELVGEIRDEHDARAEAGVEEPGAFVVDGPVPLVEIDRERGIGIPPGTAETVGGFVVAQLGRIPRAGESFAYGDWMIDVLDATPQRVRRVRFRRRPSAGSEPPATRPTRA